MRNEKPQALSAALGHSEQVEGEAPICVPFCWDHENESWKDGALGWGLGMGRGLGVGGACGGRGLARPGTPTCLLTGTQSTDFLRFQAYPNMPPGCRSATLSRSFGGVRPVNLHMGQASFHSERFHSRNMLLQA